MTDHAAAIWRQHVDEIKRNDNTPQWSFNLPTYQEREKMAPVVLETNINDIEVPASFSQSTGQQLYMTRFCYFSKSRKTAYGKKVPICLGSMVCYMKDDGYNFGTIIQQSAQRAQLIPWMKVGSKYKFPDSLSIETVDTDKIFACGNMLNANHTIIAKDKEKIAEVVSSLNTQSQSQSAEIQINDDEEEDGYDEHFTDFENGDDEPLKTVNIDSLGFDDLDDIHNVDDME